MKPPRDDQAPLPDSGRESTVALPASLSPFEWPRQDRTITPTVATQIGHPVSPQPMPAPMPAQHWVPVAGLAQASRELAREVRRHRHAMRRLVTVFSWLLGVSVVAVLLFTALLFWLVYTTPGAPR